MVGMCRARRHVVLLVAEGEAGRSPVALVLARQAGRDVIPVPARETAVIPVVVLEARGRRRGTRGLVLLLSPVSPVSFTCRRRRRCLRCRRLRRCRRRRGRRRRRRRRRGRRRRAAGAAPATRGRGLRGLVPTALGLVPGPADRSRRRVTAALSRAAPRGHGPGRRGCRRLADLGGDDPVVCMCRLGRGRRHDDLLGRDRAGRAGAGAGADRGEAYRAPGVENQCHCRPAQDERSQRRSGDTRNRQKSAPCAWFVGRHRPFLPSENSPYPDLHERYKNSDRTATRVRSRGSLFPWNHSPSRDALRTPGRGSTLRP